MAEKKRPNQTGRRPQQPVNRRTASGRTSSQPRSPIVSSSGSGSQRTARQSQPSSQRRRQDRPPVQDLRRDRRRAQIQQTSARRRKKRKRNYTLYYILLGFFLTVAGVTLSLTVFFNIKTITVTGSEQYGQEQVLAVLDAQTGDNLLRLNTGRLQQEVLDGLPAAEQVRVKRVLPSTLLVEVTDGVPVMQLYQSGTYLLLGETDRVLGINSAPQPELVTVLGFASPLDTVGSYLDQETDGALSEWLEILFSALEQVGISDISVIDLTDLIDVRLYYQNRFEIQIGSFSELETKLQMVRTALDSGKIGLEEHGIIYASATDQLIVDNAEMVLPCDAATFTWEEPAASQPVPNPASDVTGDADSNEDSSESPEAASSSLE